MALTLEPDYFISSNGLPKLNYKKYLCDKSCDRKSHRSKVENREQVLCKKTDFGEQEKRLFSGSGITESKPYCNTKKLLSRRSDMETTKNKIKNKNGDCCYCCGGKPSTKMSDKELKCIINQKIKLNSFRAGISTNSSNGMLDNRLTVTTAMGASYQQKFFNEILSDQETETIVLDF